MGLRLTNPNLLPGGEGLHRRHAAGEARAADGLWRWCWGGSGVARERLCACGRWAGEGAVWREALGKAVAREDLWLEGAVVRKGLLAKGPGHE